MEPGHNTSWLKPSGPYGPPTAMIGAQYVKNLGIEHLIGQLCYNFDIIVSSGPYGPPTAVIGAQYVKNLGIKHLIGQLCYNLDIIVSNRIKAGEFI